jgi:multidrug efflux system membrane fusion protein
MLRSVVGVLPMVALAACQGAKARDPGHHAVPVSAQVATRADVPIEIAANGNVLPISTISIKSRVDGQIDHVFFHEGEFVKEGSALFTIDPRPYRLALQQAEANLARDEVLTRNAEREAKRAAELLGQKLVSEQENDQKATQVATLQATLQADRVTVDNARINLGYTKIVAPITGRTGSLQIAAGNLVKANADAPLVVIRQISPIYVAFAVPADRLPEIQRNQERGALQVEARVPSDTTRVRGTLTFVDNTIDTATGTIALKATFPNQDRSLWPGQFVDVAMRLSMLSHAVLVPARAIMAGQRGDQAFVLSPQLVASSRDVQTGIRFGEQVVVTRGIEVGEQVVTDGQLNLLTGTKVELKVGPSVSKDQPAKPEGAPP